MANWNELFEDKENRKDIIDSSVINLVQLTQKRFPTESVLSIWDLGFGAGRHVQTLDSLGHNVFGTDNSSEALKITKEKLGERAQSINLILCDMTEQPWGNNKFHCILSIDTIHHNTLINIIKVIKNVYNSLLPKGLFMCTLKSKKADFYGKGQEIEDDTFVLDRGKEKGVPHHYFDENGIKKIFPIHKWKYIAVAEDIVHYIDENEEDFYRVTPFGFTTWKILLEKRIL